MTLIIVFCLLWASVYPSVKSENWTVRCSQTSFLSKRTRWGNRLPKKSQYFFILIRWNLGGALVNVPDKSKRWSDFIVSSLLLGKQFSVEPLQYLWEAVGIYGGLDEKKQTPAWKLSVHVWDNIIIMTIILIHRGAGFCWDSTVCQLLCKSWY